MSPKLKDQLPAILIAVVLLAVVLGGYACYMNLAVIPKLKAQHAAELQASAEQTHQQIADLNSLLKEVLQNQTTSATSLNAEVNKASTAQVDALADAIAKKIQPFNPLPKTPEEAERAQNEQVDKVSTRLADKIQPILLDISKDQNLTRASLATYSQKISDQVGSVLSGQLAQNQQLNDKLVTARSLAEQSLALSHQLAALYLSSLREGGVLTRIFSLPVDIITDASHLSITGTKDRQKKEQELIDQMNAIQKQLDALQTTPAPAK